MGGLMTIRGADVHRFVWRCFGAALLGGLALPAAAFDVTFSGVTDKDLEAELKGGSLLIEQSEQQKEKKGKDEIPDAPLTPQEIVSTAQADYKRLLAVLYDNGYFGPTIEIKIDGREAASILPVSPPKSVNAARISISPGKQFRFGTAKVGPLTPEAELPSGFAPNEIARVSLLQAAAGSAISSWRDAGYAKAAPAGQTITARHGEAKLDADISIDPGPKLRFAAPQVSGETAVRTNRILEIAGLPEGEVFSPEEMEKATERLRRTGVFRSVALIEGETVVQGDQLPVTVRVADNKPRRFGFGGELATIEGLTLSGYWLHRNISGAADRLRFDAEISGIGSDRGGTNYLLSTRYERPSTFNEDTNFFTFAEIEQLDEVSFFSRQITLSAGIERFASDERRYTFEVGFRRATTRDAFGEDDYTLLLFPTGARFDYRDNELDARSGYYFDALLTPFVAISGADNGLLSEVDLRTYKTFGTERPTTLAFRAQLGSLVGPSLRDAPADFLFYSGGGGTVRGHEYQSLGVDVGLDDQVGGRSFLGLSAEVRMRTTGSLGFVGFVDAGYIGSETFPDGSGEWQSGAGLGVRYATPIGPIRVDFAVPTSGDSDGSSFQIYIGIGHAF